ATRSPGQRGRGTDKSPGIRLVESGPGGKRLRLFVSGDVYAHQAPREMARRQAILGRPDHPVFPRTQDISRAVRRRSLGAAEQGAGRGGDVQRLGPAYYAAVWRDPG